MTITDSPADQAAELSPAKRALLEKWRRGQSATREHQIPRGDRRGPIPLSFSQRGVWFLEQLIPGTPAYNVPLALMLTGRLDGAALEQSLDALVQRHEGLRTTFVAVDGQPTQVIAPTGSLALDRIDLRSLPEADRRDRAEQLISEEVLRPFDLQRGPVFRARLIRIADEQHALVLVFHHIIFDGWSHGVFFRELATLYDGFRTGRPVELPEQPVQYADVALWQHQELHSSRIQQQLDYWRRKLGDEPPVLALPTDRPRSAALTLRGATQLFTVAPELLAAIKALAKQSRTTLYVTLLTAFKTLLYRYSGQEDFLIGTPIANRNRREVEDVLGYFTNTVALRSDFSGNPTFREMLARVHQVATEAYNNQDLPFERLVDELRTSRDMSYNPIFQVILVLQNAPMTPYLPDLHLQPIPTDNKSAIVDLWVSLDEHPDELVGVIEYNSQLFEDATIDRMIGHFLQLLNSVVADPDQRLADIPLMSAAERRQLADWNSTARPYPLDQGLHQLIEAQAARTPDATAVLFPALDREEAADDQRLSYAELNRRANQLAHFLRRLGVGPDTLVGICMERSLELVVGLLAVLKAGGAYVPLDPDYPSERLQFMLADAQVPVLLTHERVAAALARLTLTGHVVRLDRDWSQIAREPETNPALPITSATPAYMIYTSGSTGQPKGALNHHRGIVNRLLWMQEAFGLTDADRVLQKTPFSFDVSVWEFFWPLITGARLVLARPEGHKDPAYLVQLIVEQQITTLHFVPTMLGVFLEAEGLDRCTSLRRVICSGEALPYEFQERCFARLSAELYNLYGPTEAAVDVTAWRCDPAGERRIVPIGQPIANTQIYILDPYLNPTPVGVPGELYIGGVQVGYGYHNRPDLTAERFIPHPFDHDNWELEIADWGLETDRSPIPNRLYKTGDIARWLADGQIEYLGRVDDQVKLRGFRIELGEIEAVLRQHAAVQDSVVQIHEPAAGDKRLVAYIVPDQHAAELAAAAPAELAEEQVEHWQTVFDQTYATPGAGSAEQFNIVGWNSSYSGHPLPAEEMRVWVEQTVARIASVGPRRVLEIGCGTGLLLLRIAPGCAAYWGTDLSSRALRAIEQEIARLEQPLPPVRLLQRAAHDFSGLEERFDTVILNSVVQYFPSIDYLLEVLAGAIERVAAGGVIFVGDVRSLPLLAAFHTSVELYSASDELSITQLQQRVRKRVAAENELAIDPAFFVALQQRFPQIRHVELSPKRGQYDNELSRYRYDVLLFVGDTPALAAAPPATPAAWIAWQPGWDVQTIRQQLALTADVLGISGVPNARLAADAATEALLTSHGRPATVGELRAALKQGDQAGGIDPADLWALEGELPYHVTLRLAPDGQADRFDAIFTRREWRAVAVPVPTPEAAPRPWAAYANAPLRHKLELRLVPQLRDYLNDRLPDHMIPASFVLLDSIPLLPNGKVDRRALPEPPVAAPDLDRGFVAPRTRAEQQLAAIWAQVLGLEHVGVYQSFFELGGDSIRSILVVARAAQAGLKLTPRQLMQHQTIAELAELAEPIDDAQIERRRTPAPFALAPLDPQQLAAITADDNIADIYPLTPYQEHLLARARRDQTPGLYVWQRVFEQSLDLDLAAFEYAFQQVVDRHPTLRVSFQWEGLERPIQIVHRRARAALSVADWRHLSAEEQAERIVAYAEEDRRRNFDLRAPTVLRMFVARRTDSTSYLLLSGHYLRMDGWSGDVIAEELDAFYAAYEHGQPPQLAQPSSFTDYLAWLEEQDLSDTGAAAGFWRAMLRQHRAPTPLTSRVPGNQPGLAAGFSRQHTYLSAALTADLERFARQHQVTLNTLIQGAWAMLLRRYSHAERVLFGIVVGGRPTEVAGVERTVGPFMNTLPFGIDVPLDTPLVPWLKEVMAQQMELSQYEYTPLPRLRMWVGWPEQQPLFESILVYQSLWTETDRTAHEFYAQKEYPLRIDVFPEPELGIVLSYYRERLSDAAIAGIVRDIAAILPRMIADPQQPLGALTR